MSEHGLFDGLDIALKDGNGCQRRPVKKNSADLDDLYIILGNGLIVAAGGFHINDEQMVHHGHG